MNSVFQLAETLKKLCPQLELRENEPLSHHTSFRIGGPVTLMALPKSKEEAALALRTAANLGIDPILLGRGSNLLVADEGIEGFALKYVSTPDSRRARKERYVAS